jgi:hypothetical protein
MRRGFWAAQTRSPFVATNPLSTLYPLAVPPGIFHYG